MIKLAVALLGVFLATGCSSDGGDDKPKVCAPGKTEECACVGGVTKGAQTCDKTGTTWGECKCPGGSSDPDAGYVAPAECTPGGSERCECGHCGIYGQRQCDTLGHWSVCASQACTDTKARAPECFED